MSSAIFRLKSFITYWLDAVDEHSLHSPFLYDLYTRVLRAPSNDLSWLSKERALLKSDHRNLQITDFGAGSAKSKSTTRKISDIAAISVSPPKYSLLYARLIEHYNCHQIVELGTSLGLNTMYLASGKKVIVDTFEGCPNIAAVAQANFDKHKLRNITIHRGNLDETLHTVLPGIDRIDFAFMDANHKYEPTMRYASLLMEKMHESSVLVLDDIHYSSDMQRAWEDLKRLDNVYCTVDLYRCGLIFFKRSLNRQNVVLQF